MRTEQLCQRIAAAPRGVAISLVALSLLISPGFVRQTAADSAELAPERGRTPFGEREVAVFELSCRAGVFSAPCLRFTARVTEALEMQRGVAGPVRSLASERVVRADRGELHLAALLPSPLESEAGLRLLAARVRADAARTRRFVALGERATFVYAELDPGLSDEDARVLVKSIRARFDRTPDLRVTALGVGSGEPASAPFGFAALALALAAFALAPGSWCAVALAGLATLAFAAFAHGALGLLGEPLDAFCGFAPELLAASAFSASFALIQRARAERRLGADIRASVAAALAAVGPALALAALFAAGGLAALLALGPRPLLPRALAAAAGLAAGLVAYPLGVTLAGLLAWREVLARSPAELGGALARRVERGLARSSLYPWIAFACVAFATWGLGSLAPRLDAAHVRSVALDSGASGGALEPAFLERVQVFQRSLEQRPEVVWSSSLVDAIVLPANRALHGGDPVFATVPPTRDDVARALRPWQLDDRGALALRVDAERRRVAVDLLVVPSRARAPAAAVWPFASTLLALALVAALGSALLRSPRGGRICALPGALSAGVVLCIASTSAPGLAGAAAALAPLGAGVGAALGLPLLLRTRALLAAEAQLEVALSLALRESGPAIASAALASAALIALDSAVSQRAPALAALACAVPLLGAASALAILPGRVRASRGQFASARAPLHDTVSETEA